jgi:hypothetical protein
LRGEEVAKDDNKGGTEYGPGTRFMAQDVGEKYQSKIHQPAENLAICVSY